MSTTLVQLANAEYDCGNCGTTHRYLDGEIYELHLDYRTGPKRWIYEEVES